MKVHMMVKTRVINECNYKAVYFDNKTIRMKLDNTKPIQKLTYPEFYDVKITDKCFGNCPFCYQDSKKIGQHYNHKFISEYFGSMSENNRPFSVAIGGGEPTLHPEFKDILKAFKNLGIDPNYTTNGMHVTDEILDLTQRYCGGVAISTHSHLYDYWSTAINKYSQIKTNVNLHIIISDAKSVDEFVKIFNQYKHQIKYFVLLPYIHMGRAKNVETNFDYLFEILKNIPLEQIAFGANFYPYLLKNRWIPASLYEPEGFSKYIDLKDNKIYNSSFNLME